MNDERTIMQMEVHPELIRLRRERTELWKKWHEIYGPNPFQNCQQPYGAGLVQNPLAALFGNIGNRPAGGKP